MISSLIVLLDIINIITMIEILREIIQNMPEKMLKTTNFALIP